jgi:hypothetical protein
MFYDDPTKHPFHGDYQHLVAELQVPLQGNLVNTQAKLAAKVYDISNHGFSMSFVVLTQDPNVPLADPGQI